jgi:hypothetical protein
MVSKTIIIRHSAYSALSAVAVQGIAVLALSATDYGVFALYYLVFALASSGVFSILSEAWSRTQGLPNVRNGWGEYCTMLVFLSLVIVIPVLVIAQFVGRPWIAATMCAAIAFATYRLGARFYAAATGNNRLVGPADLMSGLVMVGAYFSVALVLPPLEAVSLAWCLSGAVAVVMSMRPQFQRGFRPTHWIREHRNAIQILLADSILLDLGSVGVPLAMAPMLGAAKFGVYRSVSSAAIPVRLILNPLRPFMGRRPPEFFLRGRVFLAAFSAALVMGGTIFLGLTAVRWGSWFSSGVISELSSFAVQTGIFVAFNFLGMFYYLVARTHLRARRLLTYRIVQLAGAVTFPVLGLVLWGLAGAIWGFAANAVFLCIFLILLLRTEGFSPEHEKVRTLKPIVGN